jgi:hypothetical protein
VNGEPTVFAGEPYYATAEPVFFDGNVMMQVDAYEGVPIYADTTLEPYSPIFVPVGGRLMRHYERRRARDIAGTEGSRTPWVPVASACSPEPSTGEPQVVVTSGSRSPLIGP